MEPSDPNVWVSDEGGGWAYNRKEPNCLPPLEARDSPKGLLRPEHERSACTVE